MEDKIVKFGSMNTYNYNAAQEKQSNVIGRRIAETRKRSGQSLAAFSELLAEYGVKVSGSSINKWESGETTPSGYQLLAVCHALDILDAVAFFSDSYKPRLNSIGYQKLSEYENLLIASGLYKPDEDIEIDEIIEFPLSFLPASAGSGQFLDSSTFEMRRFPKSAVPDDADFGIHICGDSMEPVYHNGQIAWVKADSELSIGDVGIFVYDGEGYIKVYNEQEPSDGVVDDFMDSFGVVHKQPVLMSYNCRYSPILVNPNTEFQIAGKVIGVY